MRTIFALNGYRGAVFVLSGFDDFAVCYIAKCALTGVASIVLIYRYLKFICFHNKRVSIMFGTYSFVLFWIIFNLLLSYIFSMIGHFIIISIGIIPIYFLVKRITASLLDSLMLRSKSKLVNENEAIVQACAILTLTIEAQTDLNQRARLIGLIAGHLKDCKTLNCPLHSPASLYDPCTHSQVGSISCQLLYTSPTFLKHFCKSYYEDAAVSFETSAEVHLAFALFLFYSLRNIHSSLSELAIAAKCKPNFIQRFEIYKLKQIIEAHINKELSKCKELYYNLTRVIEFEGACKNCASEVHQVCDAQLAFWEHLQAELIDFNILNKDGERMRVHMGRAEKFWKELCEMNPYYGKIVGKYVQYVNDIRNNKQLGNEIQEKYSNSFAKGVLATMKRDNEILFDEKAAVIHIDGKEGDAGKVMKVSKTAAGILGFSANELLHHSISKIMPRVIGKYHSLFMDNYFREGRAKFIEKENYAYAQHKDGYCFKVKLLIRQMLDLEGGFVQYVGLIVKVLDDNEYMVTDSDGALSSMTEKLAATLSIKHKWVTSGLKLHVQLFAPELSAVYKAEEDKRVERYKKSGGDELLLIVPEGFSDYMNNKDTPHSNNFNELLKLHKKEGKLMKAHELLEMEQYRNCAYQTKVRCQVKIFEHRILKSIFCHSV